MTITYTSVAPKPQAVQMKSAPLMVFGYGRSLLTGAIVEIVQPARVRIALEMGERS